MPASSKPGTVPVTFTNSSLKRTQLIQATSVQQHFKQVLTQDYEMKVVDEKEKSTNQS